MVISSGQTRAVLAHPHSDPSARSWPTPSRSQGRASRPNQPRELTPSRTSRRRSAEDVGVHQQVLAQRRAPGPRGRSSPGNPDGDGPNRPGVGRSRDGRRPRSGRSSGPRGSARRGRRTPPGCGAFGSGRRSPTASPRHRDPEPGPAAGPASIRSRRRSHRAPACAPTPRRGSASRPRRSWPRARRRCPGPSGCRRGRRRGRRSPSCRAGRRPRDRPSPPGAWGRSHGSPRGPDPRWCGRGIGGR